MAKGIFLLPNAVTDTATYRVWGAGIRDAILATGMVQTADTGQMDWATATKPGFGGTTMGYEIYRFDDSLQGTAPIFVKIYYRQAPDTVGNGYKVDIEVGTGSNGSGGITGVKITQTTANGAPSNNSSWTHPAGWALKSCHTEGVFWMVGDPYSGQSGYLNPVTFAICRTIDEDGVPTAEGCYIWMGGGTNAVGAGYSANIKQLNFTTATAYDTATTANASAPGSFSGTYNTPNKFYVSPHYACIPHPVLVDGVVSIDYGVPTGTLLSMAIQGSTPKTYMAFSVAVLYNTLPASSGPGQAQQYRGAALIWE